MKYQYSRAADVQRWPAVSGQAISGLGQDGDILTSHGFESVWRSRMSLSPALQVVDVEWDKVVGRAVSSSDWTY